MGIKPEDISARAMCAVGAMDLLLGVINCKSIKTLGLWNSNRMMTHLHTSAQPLIKKLTFVMVYNGEYYQVTSS